MTSPHRTSALTAHVTTGKTIHHGTRFYDPLFAILTLGRGRAIRQLTIDRAHINPGDTVLDIGCGTGALTMLAKVKSGPRGQVYGIDAAPEMIAEARRKAARAKLAIAYQVAAAEALPFADATFDVVLSSLMMHHLPDDLKPPVLAEIRRVLKPEGRLLVVDIGHRGLPFHGRAASGVQHLPTLLPTAGLTVEKREKTAFGILGIVRARVAG